MDSRYILSAFVGVLAVAVLFATVTTVRHVSHQPVISASR
jgi:hypothetical protein